MAKAILRKAIANLRKCYFVKALSSMKIKNQLLGAAVISAATFGVAAPSVALTDLIGNYPPNFGSGFVPEFGTTTINATQKKAVSFTTPTSAAPGELDLVSLQVILQNLDASDGATFSIREDVDGNVANANTVLTLGNADISPAPSSSLSNFTYTPSSAFAFTAGTTYWLYADVASGDFDWVSPTTANQTAPAGLAAFGGYELSTNGGTSFASSSQFNSFLVQTDNASAAVPFDFSPATGLFLIGGLWGANKLRKRKAVKITED